MYRFLSLPIILFAQAILGGCAALEKSMEKPSVSVTQVEFRQAGLQEGLLNAQIEIHNPNSFSLPVKGILYRLTLNEREFANSTMSFDKTIPAQGMVQATLPIRFRYAELIGGLSQILARQRVKFQLSGNVDIGLFRVPYRKTGEFDLR